MSDLKLNILKNVKTGEHFMKVSISSNMKPTLWSEQIVPMDNYINESDFLKAVGDAAGVLAVYQNETYNDRHDPRDFYNAAIEQAQILYNSPVVEPRDYDSELG